MRQTNPRRRSNDKADLPSKICLTCGRPFSWRKKWARDWDEVRYCSDGCRQHKARHAKPRQR